jgi:hypothetical protein
MAVADDPRLNNVAHGLRLPPSWRTLYDLSRLTDEQFDRGLSEGLIRADMERAEVGRARLLSRYKEV